jgi:hypothetical protein
MKSLKIKVISIFILAFILNQTGLSKGNFEMPEQSVEHYVIISLGEVHSKKVEDLTAHLTQLEDKILSVNFQIDSGLLTINYTDLIKFDDITQIISRYFPDFEKISGSEL